MPIHELLAQAASEYEVLQSKYDQALAEIGFLRTKLGASSSQEYAKNSTGCDTEEPPLQQQFMFDPLHKAPLDEVDCRASTGMIASMSAKSRGSRTSVAMVAQPTLQSTVDHGLSFYEEDPLPTGDSLSERSIRFLRNRCVESMIMLIVCSNIVVLIFETDMRAANEKPALIYDVLDWFFLVLYVCEFALRVIGYRKHVFADTWARIDFLVIITDLGTVLIEAIFGTAGGFNPWMFRLLRVFRLIKVSKLLRSITELHLLVHGFVGAVRAVFWATLMLEAMVLIWSLIYVEVLYPRVVELKESGVFEECPKCAKAYHSVWSAHLLLWQQIIAGDSWGMISMEVMQGWPGLSFVYIGALMSIQFAMLNLIFTVIVDSAHNAREADQQHKLLVKEKSFQGLKRQLIRLCKQMDDDDSGELTLHELMTGFETNKEFSETMLGLDINAEDVSTLFMIMDEDRSGSVSYNEFVNNIYKMKEQDLHTMLMFVKGYVIDMRFKMKEDVLRLLSENLTAIRGSSQHIEAMMVHLQNLIQRDEDARQQLEKEALRNEDGSKTPQGPSSGASFSDLSKVPAYIVETQADILRAVTAHKQTPQSPNGLLNDALLPGPPSQPPSPYLVVPKTTKYVQGSHLWASLEEDDCKPDS